MGEKKELGEKSDQSPKSHLKHFSMKRDLELGKKLEGFLMPGEVVVYQAADVFFTNRRIIKHQTSVVAKTLHYFYSTFEDIDLRFVESIKAKNVINFRLFFTGLVFIFFGPIGLFLGLIPGLEGFGSFITDFIVSSLGLGGVLAIGLILIASAITLRDRVIEFWGHGVVIRTKHFHDDELVKVRELQHLRLSRLGLDK